MRQGAQLHYETLEKPTNSRKALNISNIYIYIYCTNTLYSTSYAVFQKFRNYLSAVAFVGLYFKPQN